MEFPYVQHLRYVRCHGSFVSHATTTRDLLCFRPRPSAVCWGRRREVGYGSCHLRFPFASVDICSYPRMPCAKLARKRVISLTRTKVFALSLDFPTHDLPIDQSINIYTRDFRDEHFQFLFYFCRFAILFLFDRMSLFFCIRISKC